MDIQSYLDRLLGALTDTSIVFQNDVLKVKKEVPYECFKAAEFGCGSGQLWLQCVVDGAPFIFTTLRKNWKKPSAKLLLEKIGQYAKIEGMKEYEGYTGWKIIFYLFK